MDDLWKSLTCGSRDRFRQVVGAILGSLGVVLAAQPLVVAEVGRAHFQLRTAIEATVRREDLDDAEHSATVACLQEALEEVGAAHDVLAYIRYLLLSGATDKTIRLLAGVSTSWLQRRRAEGSLPAKYFAGTEADVDEAITEVRRLLPLAGRQMVQGALRSKGIRLQDARVRASLKRIGHGRAQPRAIKRRVYANRVPDRVWHLDGCHKLGTLCDVVARPLRPSLVLVCLFARPFTCMHPVRYRLVVTGCVCGATRKILWLRCVTNNRSWTVLETALNAARRQGRLPLRIRTDKGRCLPVSPILACSVAILCIHTSD